MALTGDVLSVDGASSVRFGPDGSRLLVSSFRGGPEVTSYSTTVTVIDPSQFLDSTPVPAPA